jgi:peptidoglycan/xylan/chitin deacetylase (PgdA/CDA1 family)
LAYFDVSDVVRKMDGVMKNVRNFLFHRVNPQRDILWDPMDIELFEKCIQYICKNFTVVLVEDLVLHKDELKQEVKYATIVFDDGYKDNIEYALPILEKYKVKASFYIVTDCIDRNIPTWTHVIDYSFQYTVKNKIDLSYDFLPEELRIQKLNDWTSRIRYVRKLKPAMKKISHVNRLRIIDTVTTAFNDIEWPSLMMNWNDLKQIQNAGHYIGSHTLSHCMLGTMTDKQEILTELSGSGERINQQLGYFPSTISYPVGSYNQQTIKLSREAGYLIGLAVKQTPYNPALDNNFEIPRIELYNEPWLKTKMRITNIVGTLSKIWNRK